MDQPPTNWYAEKKRLLKMADYWEGKAKLRGRKNDRTGFEYVAYLFASEGTRMALSMLAEAQLYGGHAPGAARMLARIDREFGFKGGKLLSWEAAALSDKDDAEEPPAMKYADEQVAPSVGMPQLNQVKYSLDALGQMTPESKAALIKSLLDAGSGFGSGYGKEPKWAST